MGKCDAGARQMCMGLLSMYIHTRDERPWLAGSKLAGKYESLHSRAALGSGIRIPKEHVSSKVNEASQDSDQGEKRGDNIQLGGRLCKREGSWTHDLTEDKCGSIHCFRFGFSNKASS